VTSVRAYVAIDIGTSAVKSGVIGRSGEVLGTASCGYDLFYPSADRVEADPQAYWDATVSAVREALSAARGLSGGELEIAGVCASCQGETLLCLERPDVPLGPAIVWLDNRAQAEAAEIGAAVDPDEMYARTGQTDSVATWPAAKLRWLREHEPERFARSAHFALLGDWIAACMCGELAAEPTLYSNTLLVDIRSRRWWDEGLALAGVDADRLPPLTPTGTVVGGLTMQAAGLLGLPAGTPVISGALDQIAAAVGAGNIRAGIVTETTGTVLALTATLEGPVPPRSSGLPVYVHAVPERFCVLPYVQTGGAVLQWLRGMLEPGSADDSDYESLIVEAARLPPGADGVTFLPHLAGAAFPEFDMRARGAIVGLTLRHDRAYVTRAALEAVAYGLRQALESLVGMGMRPSELLSLGGAARNDVWRQMKADVCGLPLRRISHPEASLLGAAMLASVAVGDYPDLAGAVSGMTRYLDAAVPDPDVEQLYADGYRRYRQLEATLRPYWQWEAPCADAARSSSQTLA
jgi:xylulokinase